MKVLSFNVLCYGPDGHGWPERKDDVIEVTRRNMPDVFGIQEAHIDWMNIFIKGMPEYDYVGVGRDDGKEEGEFSPVFYRRDKFDLLDKGWFWISETPDVPSRSWGSKCTRITSWAKLLDKQSGKTFVAMNTHLDHVSEEARKNGVRLINEFAAKLDCPVFVTGDFNVYQGEDCYVDMVEGGIFRDSKFAAEDTEDYPTFHAYFHHDGPDAVIDFIFISDGFTAKKYRVVKDKINGAFPSDHCPIVSEIEFAD